MGRNYCRLVSCLILLFVTIISTPSLNYSQAKDDKEATFIVLRITTPKGNSAKIWLVEGEMATIVDAATGSGYGFLPVVESVEERTIGVKTFEVVKTASETIPGKEVASVKMKLGTEQKIDALPFTVKAIAIARDMKDPKVPNLAPASSGLMLPGCCVGCNDETVCARCVFTDCGCCGGCVPCQMAR